MVHRIVLAAIALAFVFSVPSVASAATTISGSATASPTPSGGNMYLVIRIFNSSRVEIARNPRTPLPSGTTYPFNFTIAPSGAAYIRAYIVRPDSSNVTDYIIFRSDEKPYAAGVTLQMQQAPGTEPLPRTSAGTVLLGVGLFAAILAAGVALWRRRRSHALVRRFA